MTTLAGLPLVSVPPVARTGSTDQGSRIDSIVIHCTVDPNTATRRAWTTFIQSTADATVFHEPAWPDAVRAAFGHGFHLLTARKASHSVDSAAGELLGLLALTDVNSRLTGRRLITAAYGTSGGVLSRDAAASRLLIAEAERLATRLGAVLVELRSSEPAAAGWGTDDRYVEFVRELPNHVAELDGWLPRKARSAARQARNREHLLLRHDTGDLDLVWNLYSRSMRRLGSINYPRRFFHELAGRLGDRLWVTTVWKGPRPVAGVVSICDRMTIRPYFAGLDERLRCTGCANYLYRAVMERAVEHGLRRFDFGRTRRDNIGALEFKKNQGFEPRPVEYRRFVPSGSRPLDVSPSNPRFSAARTIWKHLPLLVTRPLGAQISRSIPG